VLKKRDRFINLGVYGRIILKEIVEKYGVKKWTGFCGSEWGCKAVKEILCH
jgi:hypothetical protein